MNKLHLIELQHHRRLLSMIWIWVPPLTVTHLASDLESLCRSWPPLKDYHERHHPTVQPQ